MTEPSIFDLLEPLAGALSAKGGPDIRGGFARGTGGVDIEYIIDAITAWNHRAKPSDEIAIYRKGWGDGFKVGGNPVARVPTDDQLEAQAVAAVASLHEEQGR